MDRMNVSRPLAPLYRVFLFGRFRIEQRNAQGVYQPLYPNRWDRQSPQRVIAYLLVTPGRHALRDVLLEALCPDENLEKAQAILTQALSLVRCTLVDEQGFPLLLPRKANQQKPLSLAGREQIWCDWDAFQDKLSRAQAEERQSGDALPLWEEAYALCQEEFLLAERYSDWCRSVRERVEGDQRLCLLHLAACYRKSGRSADAERILRSYLSAHTLDQDVLGCLMETLAEHGCIQEALNWYQRVKEALEEEGMEVAERIQETAQLLRMQHIQVSSTKFVSETQSLTSRSVLLPAADPGIQEDGVVPSTQLYPTVQGRMKQTSSQGLFLLPTATERLNSSFLSTLQQEKSSEDVPFDGATKLGIMLAQVITLIQQWYGMAKFCHELQNQIDQRIRALDMLKTHLSLDAYTLSRRSFLISLATLPATLLASSRQTYKTVLELEELLPQCAASIIACWHLSGGSFLESIPPIIDAYLPVLLTIVKNVPLYRNTTANLIAQCYFLKAILAWHLEGLDIAEAYCIQAMQYSDMTNDTNLRLTAINQHALISYYARDFQKALAKSEEARATLLHASNEYIFPIVQGRVYMYLAAFQAQQMEPGAEYTLEQAQKAFALQAARSEAVPLYADCGEASLKLWDGLTHYHIGRQNKAHIRQALNSLRVFGHLQSSAQIPERFRLECLNNRTLAAIQAGDMEEATECLKAGRLGASALESKQRSLELHYTTQEMRVRWPKEIGG